MSQFNPLHTITRYYCSLGPTYGMAAVFVGIITVAQWWKCCSYMNQHLIPSPYSIHLIFLDPFWTSFTHIMEVTWKDIIQTNIYKNTYSFVWGIWDGVLASTEEPFLIPPPPAGSAEVLPQNCWTFVLCHDGTYNTPWNHSNLIANIHWNRRNDLDVISDNANICQPDTDIKQA